MRSGTHFARESLPDPREYFAAEGLRLRVRDARGPWRSARCVFHDDTRPSLSVNIETGAYRCFACGASGGDLLDFHRARYGLSFTQAVRDLGAWRAT